MARSNISPTSSSQPHKQKPPRPKGEYARAWTSLSIVSEEEEAAASSTTSTTKTPPMPNSSAGTKSNTTTTTTIKGGGKMSHHYALHNHHHQRKEIITVGSILGEIYACELELERGWRLLNGQTSF